jgi:hypothetical protein
MDEPRGDTTMGGARARTDQRAQSLALLGVRPHAMQLPGFLLRAHAASLVIAEKNHRGSDDEGSCLAWLILRPDRTACRCRQPVCFGAGPHGLHRWRIVKKEH